jgi:5-methylcytosine-specific restriction protein A
MPYKLPHPCAHPGCPELTLKRYCPHHEQQGVPPQEQLKKSQYDKDRGSASKRGYGRQWQAIRICKLKQDPLCSDCLGAGLVVAATDVDHIDGNVHNLSVNNLRSLCHACHSRKTIRENYGFGNKPR